jgi:hypothetical protein
MDREPLHIDKKELFCNRCNKYIDKFTGTLVINNETHCLYCGNWLCGCYDAFGCEMLLEDPTIVHCKLESTILGAI